MVLTSRWRFEPFWTFIIIVFFVNTNATDVFNCSAVVSFSLQLRKRFSVCNNLYEENGQAAMNLSRLQNRAMETDHVGKLQNKR